MKRSLLSALIIVMLAGATAPAQTAPSGDNEARLLRFPDVSRDKIVFSYGGDIYVAPRSGGQAVRLTGHEGLELFPRFSPDGSLIAFTGQYDGDMSVYQMPANGGEPKRLTWHPGLRDLPERFGPENVVMGWTKDGRKILYRSRKESMTWWDGKVYTVSPDGGQSEPLPMPVAGFTSFSPDGKKVAYCPIYRDFRTWKRYKGGMAQDVWIFDLTTFASEKITDWVGTDNLPMWYGDKIYFNSDRTANPDSAGTLNIWCYDTKTKETRRVTDFSEYDVRWPSLGTDAIAFENGGFIHLLELPGEQLHKVAINLITDRHTMRPEVEKVSDRLYGFDLSPDSKRAVFSGRGDIFTVPFKDGNTRNLTNLPGSKEIMPRWSPDGKWIAYNSDQGGEQEFYLVSSDGKETIRLTTDGKCYRWAPTWSPDSKKLVFSDRDQKIYLLDIDSRKVTQIDRSDRNIVREFSWSSDSRYLAYAKILPSQIWAVFAYSTADNILHQVTPGFTNDYGPSFDPDGKYLYFLSERNFNPLPGNYEFQVVNSAITNIYLLLLQALEKSPFGPKSDEVEIAESKTGKSEPAKADKGKDEPPRPVETKIDFAGIYDRQVAFDLPAGEYSRLRAVSGALFYIAEPLAGFGGRIGSDEPVLHKYDMKEKKNTEFAAGANNFVLSAKQDKMLLQKGGGYFIIETQGKKADLEDKQLDLSHMEMLIDHQAEYAHMYREVWRMERDFFYDSLMHGVDWNKIYERYAVLLPHVINRFDLTYVIGEMLGELCCSHTYTGDGELPRIQSSAVGLLGADFEIDRAANRIRILKILKGENWDPGLRSPLTEPGINVKPGDYILAVDGRELTAASDPYAFLANATNRTVTLKINDRPVLDGAREIVVKPIPSEEYLRYYNWVEERRLHVDSVSGGRIGYIHIPDMDTYGLVRFMKMFYSQIYKEGLIIDVRYNGGGFVSSLILKRLDQPVTAMYAGRDQTVSPNGINAHMITLLNEFSCSDGDNFPFFFRERKMGPLLGKRSWGGVVGYGGWPPLLDGGFFTIPEGTSYNLKGEWNMENVGVFPDMEIDNMPARLIAGHDDQLDRAIEYLQKKMNEEPRTLPPRPAPPSPR